MKKILVPSIIGAAFLLLAAACGNSNANSNMNTDTTNTSVFDTNTMLNTNTDTTSTNDNVNMDSVNSAVNSSVTNTNATSNTNSTTSASVSIDNFTFSPMNVTVAKGGSVTFTNNDTVSHTVKLDAESTAHTVAPGSSYTLSTTSLNAGTYSYHCSIHPSMTGSITVTS